MPVVPHFSNECLHDLDELRDINWPKFNKQLLDKEEINFVVQINGKKRALLNIKRDINETEVLAKIKKDKIVDKYLNKKDIKKVIFVQNRLINILIND